MHNNKRLITAFSIICFFSFFQSIFADTQAILEGSFSVASLGKFHITLVPEVSLYKVFPSNSFLKGSASLYFSSASSDAPDSYNNLFLIPFTLSYGKVSKQIFFDKFKPFFAVNGSLNYASAPFDIFSFGYGVETGVLYRYNDKLTVLASIQKNWLNNNPADPFLFKVGCQKSILLKEGRLTHHAKLVKRLIRKQTDHETNKENNSTTP